jgi:hypothetical protein
MNRIFLQSRIVPEPGLSWQAVERRAGARRRGGDGLENRSAGCGRILAAVRATEIGVEIRRLPASLDASYSCERNRASGK